MPERVQSKVALVVGGGQSPGDGLGNDRATSILLAREGARLLGALSRRVPGETRRPRRGPDAWWRGRTSLQWRTRVKSRSVADPGANRSCEHGSNRYPVLSASSVAVRRKLSAVGPCAP